MSVKPFSEREFELMKLAFQCVEEPKGLKIDLVKFQGLGGFSTVSSARSSWCSLKNKLGVTSGKAVAANTEDSSNTASAEAETPKPKKRKRAPSPSGDSPVSAKKKRATKAAPAKEEPKLETIKSEQEASPKPSPEAMSSSPS